MPNGRKAMRESNVLVGKTRRIRTGCGSLYCTINTDSTNEPHEVFIRLGKAGGCASAWTEAMGRLISIAIRSGVSVEEIHSQLRSIGCHLPVFTGDGGRVVSCVDAVARVICEEWMGNPMDDSLEGMVTLPKRPDMVEACSDCRCGLSD